MKKIPFFGTIGNCFENIIQVYLDVLFSATVQSETIDFFRTTLCSIPSGTDRRQLRVYSIDPTSKPVLNTKLA